jgi:predicted house-cleaning noncanonical NTP pyrophosphatase (MazG superfamily)
VREHFDKLVRDRIPEIIRAEGRTCQLEILDDETYLVALMQKLVEEAQELTGAAAEKRKGELADILEVLEAIIAALGYDLAEIREQQRNKRAERGGFEGKIRLLWVE